MWSFAFCEGSAMRHENSNYHGPSIVMGNSNKGGRPESSLDTMDFASMSIDKLQKLRERVDAVLAKKNRCRDNCSRTMSPAAWPGSQYRSAGISRAAKSRGRGASALSSGLAKVPQSIATIGNVGRSRKATAVADRAA